MTPSQLPGEILSQIIQHVLSDTPKKSRDSKPQVGPSQQAKAMAMVDNTFRAAVDNYHQRAFHTFHHNGEPTVLGSLQPWIPRHDCPMSEHMTFWQERLGSAWPGTADLEEQISDFDERKPHNVRSVRVDARVPGFSRTPDCLSWTKSNFNTWMLSAALLCRIAQPNPRLRVLHLRLSAHADFYTVIEGMIASNPRLTDIVIEDDSHPDLDGLRRPVLDLASLCNDENEDSYHELERFIIRAPAVQVNAVDCGPFFSRIRSAETFCLAVHQFITRQSPWLWVLDLLKNMRYVDRFEVSMSLQSNANYRTLRLPVDPIELRYLKHLVLDLTEVDARLLSRLQAPLLKHMQVRSLYPVASHGDLAINHFPSLLCATIWCPGGAIERFRFLGLRKRQYIHNIPDELHLQQEINEGILIYVLKINPSLPTVPEDTPERPSKRARTISSGLQNDAPRPQSI